jgi:hypothetical protein
MRWRAKPSVDGSVFAIYSVPFETSTDDAPLTNPFGNKSRLQIHTAAILPSTTPALTQTVTVSVGAIAANTKFQGASFRQNLFAHGLGDACMVEGRILDLNGSGNHVDFNGSVPVDVNARGFGMWLALGSTSTHVIVEWFGITQAGQSLAARTYQVEASAYNYLASGAAPTSDPSLPRARNYPGSHTILARGAIDTRRRYVRAAGSGPNSAIAVAETMRIIGRGIGDDTTSGNPSYVQFEIGWRWRYSVNGYVRQTTTDWRGGATNGGTYDAPVLQVKR